LCFHHQVHYLDQRINHLQKFWKVSLSPYLIDLALTA
jgi:hypothetical protein